ncbi:chromosome segregation ATPase [Bradyrhizobium sp. LB11.1]
MSSVGTAAVITSGCKYHLMSATVVPLPPNSASETTDFLRRMASMVSGRNGEMLLRAASLIESLGRRAMSAERLFHEQQEENKRHAERHEAAELASDAMVNQIAELRAQLAEVTSAAAAERAAFDTERSKLLGLMQDAESHIGKLTTELDTLRASVDAFNETVVSVPIEVLRLARTQFDHLSRGFERKGDVISQTMSEIGGFAIDQALTANKPAEKA